MKRLSALLLCLVLCLSCVAIFASCDEGTSNPATDAPTEAPTNGATEAPTDDATEAPTEDATEAPTDENPGSIYDDELVISIGTAEELMAFNKAVNEDGEFFGDKVILFTADIDMTGHVWTPLDGPGLYGTTFDGQGHTISNIQFADHEPESGTPAADVGSGFVGVARGDLTFKNLTLKDCKVNGYERAVANFVGLISSNGYLIFENCKSIGFQADGWMDWNNQDRNNGGHPIAQRLAGFIGHMMAGNASFTDCHVEDIKITGLQNLAGFVGYDATNTLDQFAFENCSVKNAEFYFSYCMMDGKTIDMQKKFVSVFYNGKNWIDNIDLVADPDLGNTYESIRFYDASDDNAEYDPSNLRSWTQEEYEESKKDPAN